MRVIPEINFNHLEKIIISRGYWFYEKYTSLHPPQPTFQSFITYASSMKNLMNVMCIWTYV